MRGEIQVTEPGSTRPLRAAVASSPLVQRPSHPRWRQARRLLWKLLVLAALGITLAVFHRPLLTGYARLFEVNDPAPSDAIVLLLGGLGHRPEQAAALYHQGLAPRIVFVTLQDNLADNGETPQTLRKLLRLGVPRKAIFVLPDYAESTRQEAKAMRKEAERHGWKRILVVTSDFHTRRARWIFERELAGTGIAIHMAIAPDPSLDSRNWWRTDEGLVRYVSETIKSLYYWLRY